MSTKTSTNASAISSGAAKVSVGLAGLALVLMVLLHIVEPEFDPSWRFVSEYANGDQGWMMQLVFLSLAGGLLASFFAIKSQVQTIWGKIGLAVSLLAVTAMSAAAFFAIDPITSSKDELTTQGNIHGLTAMVGNPSFGLAALLIGISLTRSSLWAGSRRALLAMANFPWISFVIMLGSMFATLPKDGTFGPDVLIGWPNRLVILAYIVWIGGIGLLALKARAKKA